MRKLGVAVVLAICDGAGLAGGTIATEDAR